MSRSSRNREVAQAAGQAVARVVRAQRAWRKQITGELEFLEKLADVHTLGDDKWRNRMRLHYVARIQAALSSPPQGTELDVRRFRERLKRV